MKKIIFLVTILLLSAMPMALASGVGGNLRGTIGVEEFTPLVFQCGNRVLADEDVQPWRTSNAGQVLIERNQQYLFDGERYQVDILVFDKNKIQDDIVDLVFEGDERCECNLINGTCVKNCTQFPDLEINCNPISMTNITPCNARIDEEPAMTSFDDKTMSAYGCTVTIPNSEHMYGLYLFKARATPNENLFPNADPGEYKEIARWFINPIISLSVDGDLNFSDVRPGTSSYSTVLLENTAEGGVLLDMFITGKDWPAVGPHFGQCQDVNITTGDVVNGLVNYIPLGAFRYYAENGAFSTRDDLLHDNDNYGSTTIVRDKDFEGYLNFHRQVNAGFEEAMFDEAEILQANGVRISDGVACSTIAGSNETCFYKSNVLYPGSAGMSLTFRLNLPEPCYGEYESPSTGSIFFWAEAI